MLSRSNPHPHHRMFRWLYLLFNRWHHARVPAAKKPAAKSPAAKKPAAKRPAAKKAAPKKMAARADLGAPVDGFFAAQEGELGEVLRALRSLIEKAAPTATSSLKWGMPFYQLNGKTLCALGGHKAHVNLILSGPPGTFSDPKGRLIGDGKTGRHLKLSRVADLPTKEVQGWLREAIALANS
jgi:hypothetical protein